MQATAIQHQALAWVQLLASSLPVLKEIQVYSFQHAGCQQLEQVTAAMMLVCHMYISDSVRTLCKECGCMQRGPTAIGYA